MAEHLDRSRSDAKNKASKLRYWQGTHLAQWSLLSIRPSDLVDWRRLVLDEDGAEYGDVCGPDAECGPQTVVHRLNVLSQLYKRWALNHDVTVNNPVIEGVRSSLPSGRDRRLKDGEEERLLAAAAKSSRPWLPAAIIIALETCMRQAELSGLTWGRTKINAEFPHVDLPKTKNDRPRRVPLACEPFLTRSNVTRGVALRLEYKDVFGGAAHPAHGRVSLHAAYRAGGRADHDLPRWLNPTSRIMGSPRRNDAWASLMTACHIARPTTSGRWS